MLHHFSYTPYLIALPPCLSSPRVLWNSLTFVCKVSCRLKDKSIIIQIKVKGREHIHFICPKFMKKTSRWKFSYIFTFKKLLMKLTSIFMSELIVITSKINGESPSTFFEEFICLLIQPNLLSVYCVIRKCVVYTGEQLCHDVYSTNGFCDWMGRWALILEMMMLSGLVHVS